MKYYKFISETFFIKIGVPGETPIKEYSNEISVNYVHSEKNSCQNRRHCFQFVDIYRSIVHKLFQDGLFRNNKKNYYYIYIHEILGNKLIGTRAIDLCKFCRLHKLKLKIRVYRVQRRRSHYVRFRRKNRRNISKSKETPENDNRPSSGRKKKKWQI